MYMTQDLYISNYKLFNNDNTLIIRLNIIYSSDIINKK